MCFVVTLCLAALSQLSLPPVAMADDSAPAARLAQLPVISNHNGASNITATTARLNGKVVSRGCPPAGVDPIPASVNIYWGTYDGGNLAYRWEHDINMGSQSVGVFGAYLSGLKANTTYYYRSYIRNSAGAAWAAGTAYFTTQNLPE